MRREIILGSAAALLAGAVTVDWWLPGKPYLPWAAAFAMSAVALLLLLAPAMSVIAALRDETLSGSAARRDALAHLWTVVKALPVWILAVLAVVFVATQTTVVAGMMWLVSKDPGVHVDVYWSFAGAVAGGGAVMAAVAYGLEREGRTGLLAMRARRG